MKEIEQCLDLDRKFPFLTALDDLFVLFFIKTVGHGIFKVFSLKM